jgi:hypothetical protein
MDPETQIKLEELKQQAETARQNQRYTFYGTVFTGIVTVLTGTLMPLLLRSYHAETLQKVEDGKAEVQQVAESANTHAAAAVVNTKKLEDKADANLLLWKAYHTKDSGDMDRATEVLAKAAKE